MSLLEKYLADHTPLTPAPLGARLEKALSEDKLPLKAKDNADFIALSSGLFHELLNEADLTDWPENG